MSKDAKAALDELCAACCGAGAPCAGALRAALERVHDRSAGAAPRLVAGSDLETIWQQRQFRNRAIDRHALAAGRWLARHAAETSAGGETVTGDDANSARAERRAVEVEGRLGDVESRFGTQNSELRRPLDAHRWKAEAHRPDASQRSAAMPIELRSGGG